MNIDRKKIRIFLCALWPGGGYMYFGMMKKGTMVMALFTAVAGLTLTIGWKFLAFLLPVIWCYCFSIPSMLQSCLRKSANLRIRMLGYGGCVCEKRPAEAL